MSEPQETPPSTDQPEVVEDSQPAAAPEEVDAPEPTSAPEEKVTAVNDDDDDNAAEMTESEQVSKEETTTTPAETTEPQEPSSDPVDLEAPKEDAMLLSDNTEDTSDEIGVQKALTGSTDPDQPESGPASEVDELEKGHQPTKSKVYSQRQGKTLLWTNVNVTLVSFVRVLAWSSEKM